MDTLFPVEPAFPQGFAYVPGFITVQEEQELIEAVTGIALHTFTFQGYTARRNVASFGWDWNFERQQLVRGKDIPPVFEPLLDKAARHLSLPRSDFAELLVTEYPPGSVINWHRDAPPFDLIAGLSLLSDCVFRLRPYEAAERTRKSVLSFPVARRSLYVMQGKARTEWQHSIAPVKGTRYSITLRTLREPPRE